MYGVCGGDCVGGGERRRDLGRVDDDVGGRNMSEMIEVGGFGVFEVL